MTKLLKIALTLCILITLSNCKKEEAPLFNEESIKLISEYSAPDFGEDYNLQIEEYDPNTDITYYHSYYDFLTRPSCMFKLTDAKTFMDIVTEKEELSQFFVLIGDKNQYKTYTMMEQIQEQTSQSGIVTFFIDVNDIYNNQEVYDWYMNYFDFNTSEYKAEVEGYLYKGSEFKLGESIMTPTIICWWNQTTFFVEALGPNMWKTDDKVKEFFQPISDEIKEMYPLGSLKDITY